MPFRIPKEPDERDPGDAASARPDAAPPLRPGRGAPDRPDPAAMGRLAGQQGVPAAELSGQDAPPAQYFAGRAEAQASLVRAQGYREASNDVTADDPDAARAQFESSTKALAERAADERRRQLEAEESARADQAKLDELPAIERGLIGPDSEAAITVALGLADAILLALYIAARVEVSVAVAWIAAGFVGLGASLTGWAVGRVLAALQEPAQRQRVLTGAVAYTVTSLAWFVLSMDGTRTGEQMVGVAATISFGAPLCSMTVGAAAIVALLGGTAEKGRRLRASIASALTRAVAAGRAADDADRERRDLADAYTKACSARALAERRAPLLERAIEAEAGACVAQGRADLGEFLTYHALYTPRPPVMDLHGREQLSDMAHALERHRLELARRRRLISMLLGALGAGGGSLLALALDLPPEVVAAAAAAGATVSARRAAPAEAEAAEEPAHRPTGPSSNGGSPTKPSERAEA